MSPSEQEHAEKHSLIAEIGSELVRFQDASNRFDDMAAAALALTREDLACVSFLLFGGPRRAEEMGRALDLRPRVLGDAVERLELAGYARRRQDGALELTEHARAWVETIWGPLQADGAALLAAESLSDLRHMARVMRLLRPMQERHAARVAALLEVPSKPSNRRRGGLSPAALRRVQLYVEANLAAAIQVSDLAARAGLSEFHFARAFKVSTGTTPRAFVEGARIGRARALLRETKLPLAEIAAATGLGTQSRFTTTFRRATGLTPATYRRGDAG